MKTSLILTCAGKGERAGFEKNKLLTSINGTTVLERSFSTFVKSGLIDEYVITASKEDFNEISLIANRYGAKTVLGGLTRTDSVKNALTAVSGDVVLIHDGARPFVSQRIIKDCVESARKFGSGITAIKSRDTVSKGKTEITDYLGKEEVLIIQTPQAFNLQEIKTAYKLANGGAFNDDGEVYKTFIKPPHVVQGDYDNLKLTYKKDFELLLNKNGVRVGTGFDCHRLVENRKLILGGVEIPHCKGLLGHSDADVLTHAVADAILSAASLRDIGYHFPDTDPTYKGACSIELLKKVLLLIKEKGYKVNNMSAVIMAEKPKLLGHIPAITQNLANVLSLSQEEVGIGATTLEGLGFVGREEGICVYSTATLIKTESD